MSHQFPVRDNQLWLSVSQDVTDLALPVKYIDRHDDDPKLDAGQI